MVLGAHATGLHRSLVFTLTPSLAHEERRPLTLTTEYQVCTLLLSPLHFTLRNGAQRAPLQTHPQLLPVDRLNTNSR
jgi:hypothetical protein